MVSQCRSYCYQASVCCLSDIPICKVAAFIPQFLLFARLVHLFSGFILFAWLVTLSYIVYGLEHWCIVSNLQWQMWRQFPFICIYTNWWWVPVAYSLCWYVVGATIVIDIDIWPLPCLVLKSWNVTIAYKNVIHSCGICWPHIDGIFHLLVLLRGTCIGFWGSFSPFCVQHWVSESSFWLRLW